MDRRGASILLVPLIAAFALLYPGSSRNSSTASQPFYKSLTNNKGEASAAEGGWRGVHDVLLTFFEPQNGHSSPVPGLRKHARIQFLIANLPDPVDSGLPYAFDRFIGSMQAAIQSQGYFLADFDLPWSDCLSREESDNSRAAKSLEVGLSSNHAGLQLIASGEDDKCNERRFEKVPGFLLFSNPHGDRRSPDLLFIYLIGSTPTTGTQKRALLTALDDISDYCAWSPKNPAETSKKTTSQTVSTTDWPMSETCSNHELRMLGPTFTGSAQSLDIALSTWLDTHPAVQPKLQLNLISGSATAVIEPDEGGETCPLNTDADFYNVRARLTSCTGKSRSSRFSFRSMVNPDNLGVCEFLQYLRHDNNRVAILVESNTRYGQRAQQSTETNTVFCNDPGWTTIPYPLHISQLRAASERSRRAQRESNAQSQITSNAVPLSESLEDIGSKRDIDIFSTLHAPTAEEVMATVLATISREQYRYVGIFATDVRDTIFLAQEVHEHAPAAVLFTFNADILLLHPDVNPSLRGMLVISSYPLNTANQLWSLPSNLKLRMQFADEGSQGTYNATLALLGARTHMLEYSAPFLDSKKPTDSLVPPPLAPPVWISVVGKDHLWPVEAYDTTLQHVPHNYAYPLSVSDLTSSDASSRGDWLRGLFPQTTFLFIVSFAAFSLVFSMVLFRVRSSRDIIVTRTSKGSRKTPPFRERCLENFEYFSLPIRSEWLDRIAGPPWSENFRRQGDLFLFAAASSLLAFLVVTTTASALPAVLVRWRFGANSTHAGVEQLIAASLCFLGSAFLLLGMLFVLRALRSNRNGWKFGSQANFPFSCWGPIILVSTIVVAIASVFSWKWFSELWNNDQFRSAMFRSLRSLDFGSGVSALTPLILISAASFLWAVGSFHRTRMLEGFENEDLFLRFSLPHFSELGTLEKRVRCNLHCAARRLPGAIAVYLLTVVSLVFIATEFVHSFEDPWFYVLLAAAYFSVILALCQTVVRFYSVWRATHHLLQHLACTPILAACKRFRTSFASWPKVDLASPAPSLSPLALALDQATTLVRRAGEVLAKRNAHSDVYLETHAQHLAQKTGTHAAAAPALVVDPEYDALRELSNLNDLVSSAEVSFNEARSADTRGDWRQLVVSQSETQESIALMAEQISKSLRSYWWLEMRSGTKDLKGSASDAETVFLLGEEFLAARISHLLAHVFPQMQMLIYTPVVGVLLLLLAVSAYPFQPHSLLLMFNSVVILLFVAIAFWAFIGMNRDPVLSSLNGTKPGEITWDKQFLVRVAFYGLVPLLALLGAQFPESVNQFISYILPATGGH